MWWHKSATTAIPLDRAAKKERGWRRGTRRPPPFVVNSPSNDALWFLVSACLPPDKVANVVAANLPSDAWAFSILLPAQPHPLSSTFSANLWTCTCALHSLWHLQLLQLVQFAESFGQAAYQIIIQFPANKERSYRNIYTTFAYA